MRTKLVVGNWKMNTSPETARQLAQATRDQAGGDDRVQVVVCPPFPFLGIVHDALQGGRVSLGAQNCFHELKGAFTGEVSPQMLVEMGCRWVILGHSERRRKLGESSEFVNRKVHRALEVGLNVIVCVGETKEERDAGQEEAVVVEQLRGSLAHYPLDRLDQLVLAYEPVWAIGTGVTATPEQVQALHGFVRRQLCDVIDEEAAQALRILYGGSVTSKNAATLLSQADVDGVLVGGASLEAKEFTAIVQAAVAC